ncbi:hypothetical protein FIBSPDRAFT_193041 [Athelia psychrophila]|uniref:Uncharacterized protein n=1 Tax=Athelia psychrophila TaxID=1759441 RepID=A0A166SH63_9AGAM|nr:hypothetical protein FIBSPDRAFT_193041 [Fibularhizoctonia sp. CBS 109695]
MTFVPSLSQSRTSMGRVPATAVAIPSIRPPRGPPPIEMIANRFRTSIRCFCPASLQLYPLSSEHAGAQYRMCGCAGAPSSSSSTSARLAKVTQENRTYCDHSRHVVRSRSPSRLSPADTATLRWGEGGGNAHRGSQNAGHIGCARVWGWQEGENPRVFFEREGRRWK